MSEPIPAQIAPHQQRVIDEKEALDEKITKLKVFVLTKTYGAIAMVERNALSDQLDVMVRYSEILGQRIRRFST